MMYHQSSDLTHNILNICNYIPANVLGLILEFTFSRSSQKNALVVGKWSSTIIVSESTHIKAYMYT